MRSRRVRSSIESGSKLCTAWFCADWGGCGALAGAAALALRLGFSRSPRALMMMGHFPPHRGAELHAEQRQVPRQRLRAQTTRTEAAVNTAGAATAPAASEMKCRRPNRPRRAPDSRTVRALPWSMPTRVASQSATRRTSGLSFDNLTSGSASSSNSSRSGRPTGRISASRQLTHAASLKSPFRFA